MNAILAKIRREPALLYATLAAVVTMLAAVGLALGPIQVAAISGLITVALAWLGIRPAVTPVEADAHALLNDDITLTN